MKLLRYFVIIITWIRTTKSTDVLYILSDNSPKSSCPSQPCATFSQYLLDSGTLPVVSNAKYYLLPGEHHVPPNMVLIGLSNFTLVGTNNEDSLYAVLIGCLEAILYVVDSKYVTIANVVFKQCRIPDYGKRQHRNETNLMLVSCLSFIIENVTFFEYGLLSYNLIGNSYLKNVVVNLTIVNPTSYVHHHGITLEYDSISNNSNNNYSITIIAVSITGCGNKYLYDDHHHMEPVIYALFILLYQENFNLAITVKDSQFYSMDQASVLISSQESINFNTISITNCIFKHIKYHFSFSYKPMISIVPLSYNTLVTFSNCTFMHNERWHYLVMIICNNNLSSFLHNKTSQFPSTINIKACRFISNGCPTLFIANTGKRLAHHTPSIFLIGPITIVETQYTEKWFRYMIFFGNTIVTIHGPFIISRNVVGELMVFDTCQITVSNVIVFAENNCTQIIRLSLGTVYITIVQHSNISFIKNYVSNELIAIENDEYNAIYPYCIFQYTGPKKYAKVTITPATYKINFHHNININDSTKTKQCKQTFHHFTSHCKWTSMSVFQGYDPGVINQMIIQSNDQQISEHTTICHCPNNFTSNCTSDILGPVYPGQTLQVALCLPCSGDDATLYTDTHNALLPPSACRIAHQYQLITFITSRFQTVNFTIVSDANDVCELFLTASPNLYKIYEIFYVKLLPCPIGFVLKNGTCDCDPTLKDKHIHIDTCYIDQSTIRRPDNSWISHIQSNYLLCKNCPMDYCLPQSSNVNLENPDMQCQFNRTGILCSQCQHSLSMVFGSSRCVHCTNVHLLVSVIVLVAGIVLVTLLYILNLTVTTGTINGIIFYANIININDSVFLVNDNVFKPLRLFVSWVNLDLGIETCFYDGMDGYAKIILQVFFPLYLMVIATIIIVLSRYSSLILRLTYSRSLPVLATLFLLSYTSILRTVLTVLFSYSTITELPSGHQQLVWSIDASVPLFGAKFMILFITCLVLFLLLIPFNVIVGFARCLSRFATINRFKPLLDAFQGPFKDKCYYWIGLGIVLRSVFFSLYAFSSNTKLIISTMVLMIFNISFGFIHPNKNKLVNIQELSLLLNLAIMYAVSYQENSRIFSTISNVMISLAFVQFCVIVSYHFLAFTCHCNLFNISQIVKFKFIHAKQSHGLADDIALLNIPERAYNYSEYQDGLISDDFTKNNTL